MGLHPRSPWFRLCLDVDSAGQPIGRSYEVRLEDGPNRVVVLSPPGPFESPEEAFTRLYVEVQYLHGWARRLPWDPPAQTTTRGGE